jgi:hypothetical protein
MSTIAIQATAAVVVAICFSATFLVACIFCLSGRISREQGESE